MKKEPNITERQAREIVEKMGRREPYTSKSIDDFYRSIGLEPEEPEQPGKTVTEEAEIPMAETSDFSTFIRQATQGRGHHTIEFLRYDPAVNQK